MIMNDEQKAPKVGDDPVDLDYLYTMRPPPALAWLYASSKDTAMRLLIPLVTQILVEIHYAAACVTLMGIIKSTIVPTDWPIFSAPARTDWICVSSTFALRLDPAAAL